MRLNVIAFWIASMLTTSAAAQVVPGTYAHGAFDARGQDVINLGNLNIRLDIPIVNKIGRGLPFDYSLAYDSSIWYPAPGSGGQTWKPTANWGWNGDTNAVTGFITYGTDYDTYAADTDGPDPENPSPGTPSQIDCHVTRYNNWVYHDALGAVHTFEGSTGSLTSGPNGYCGAQYATFDEQASDGSGYTLHVNNYTTAYLTAANGSGIDPATPTVHAGVVKDRNGNEITVDSSGHFIDTTGTVALTVTSGGANSKTLTYKDATGADRTVVVSYLSHTVKTNFGCSGISEYPAQNTYLVDRVTFPDARYFYQFTYEATPGYAGDTTGRVSSVRTPTGGVISYQYTGPSNGITCADGSTAGLIRSTSATTSSASTTVTYTRSSSGPTVSHTNVTDGVNSASYDFIIPDTYFYRPYTTATAWYYLTSKKIYTGTPSGAPLLAEDTCYNNQTCNGSGLGLPLISKTIVTSYDNVATKKLTISYSGDTYEESERDNYEFGNGAPGSLLTLEATEAHVVNGGAIEVDSTSVSTPNAVVGRTEYLYDQAGLVATTGVPAHVSGTVSDRGNLTATKNFYSDTQFIEVDSTYYDTGSVASITDPLHGSTHISYDSSYVYPQTIIPATPASGTSLATGTGYDVAYTGLPTDFYGLNATLHVIGYDSMLRPTGYTYPNGSTSLTYAPNQQSQTRSMSAGSEDREQLFDEYGRTRREALATGQTPGAWYVQDTCYGADGETRFRSTPYQTTTLTGSQVCSGLGDTYTYDGLHRLLQIQHGTTPVTSVLYTYKGRTVKRVDENNVTQLTQYDGLGRVAGVCEVTSVTLPNSGAPIACGMDIAGTGYTTTYSYDLANHKTTISQGGQQREFGADWLGRTISVTEPESGVTAFGYAVNSFGLVITRVKGRANQPNPSLSTTTTTQLDTSGRVLSITYSDGTPTKSYNYDQTTAAAAGNASLGYSKGLLTSFIAGNTQGFYGYDAAGRVNLVLGCQPVSCAGFPFTSQAYTYDGVGNLLSASDGTGRTVSYQYTTASEPISAASTTLTGVSTPLVSGAAYGPFGATVLSLASGLNHVNGYDSKGALSVTSICSGSAGLNCSGGQLLYNMSLSTQGGQVTSAFDSILNQSLSFGYDAMNRLAARSTTSGPAQTFSYNYDRWGNRVSQIAMNNGPSMYTSFNTGNNQIVTANNSSYTYDAAGNVWKINNTVYSHDAEGNLTAVSGDTTANYVYNALNQRVETITFAGTQQFLFTPNGNRAATLDGSGTPISAEAYFAGAALAYFKAGAFHYQHQDWIGTERLRTSQTGVVEATYASYPFGEAMSSTGTNGDPSHYTGLDTDIETGNAHAMFRDYNSTTGTWMSPDPYSNSYTSKNPQSLNRYTYVLNNPLLLRDPTGLFCEYGQGNSNEVLDEVDYDSSPGECSRTGGVWYPDGGATYGDSVAYDGGDEYGGVGAGLTGYIEAGVLGPLDLTCASAILSKVGISARQQIRTAQAYIAGGKAGGSSAGAESLGGNIVTGAVGSLLGAFYGYAQAVRTGGPNDIKNLPGHNPADPNDIAAGNVSFGITCPFGPFLCQVGAGVAQGVSGSLNRFTGGRLGHGAPGPARTYFDSPSDNQQIQMGQAIRAAGCHE